jgi:hypothetical protein
MCKVTRFAVSLKMRPATTDGRLVGVAIFTGFTAYKTLMLAILSLSLLDSELVVLTNRSRRWQI